MKLYWSPRSPFVRKVLIVLSEGGLSEKVERVQSVVALAAPPNLDVLKDNPLGKIPVLVTADGALFDSRVICEYLDTISGTGLFPTAIVPRMQALRWQSLADGMTDILLLWRYELNRAGGPWSEVCRGYETKIRATMARLEAEAQALAAAPFSIGHISIVCALGQLDFRWPGSGWNDAFPALSVVHAALSDRPSVKGNPVVDDLGASAGAQHPLQFLQEKP